MRWRMMALTSSIALALILLAGAVAWAGVNHDGYPRIKRNATPPSEQLTGKTLTDSLAFDTPITGRMQATVGNTTVCVQADLSGAAADTVLVYFVPFFTNSAGTITRLPGLQSATATAGAGTDAASDSVCNALFFEIPSGATHYEIRHAAPSAGNVDLKWIAYSASPQ